MDNRRIIDHKFAWISASVCVSLLFFALAGVTESTNRSGREKRTFSIRREADHPLNALRIRNVDSPGFPYDLEIEVKNVSNKPIYFFRVVLVFPEVPGPSGAGTKYSMPLYYGRPEMIGLNVRPNGNDLPINPGQTYVLRLPEEYIDGLKAHVMRANVSESSFDRFQIDFREVNFGDGTGFKAGLRTSIQTSDGTASASQQEQGKRTCSIRREGIHPLKLLDIRNVDSDNFPYDFEIDLENVSPKPIYFFRVNLEFPDVPGWDAGSILGYPLCYGRFQMINLGERATADDLPLRPGETITLRLLDWQKHWLRKYRSSANIQDAAFENFTIDFQEVRFGDGTGFSAGLGLVPRSNHIK